MQCISTTESRPLDKPKTNHRIVNLIIYMYILLKEVRIRVQQFCIRKFEKCKFIILRISIHTMYTD